MRRFRLTAPIAIILLLLAGLADASVPMAEAQPEPCPEMAASDHHPSAPAEAPTSSSHDCGSECVCCPGFCSGALVLLSDGHWSMPTGKTGLTAVESAHPIRQTCRLLRPPISA